MGPADEWLYEYAVVRYMPKPERGEFINIGLIMMNKRKKWLKGKILLHPRKILSINPHADLEFLTNQTSLFERSDVPNNDLPVEEKYRWLAAEKSACIRMSPSHPGIVKVEENCSMPANEIMEIEFSRLFSLLVE